MTVLAEVRTWCAEGMRIQRVENVYSASSRR